MTEGMQNLKQDFFGLFACVILGVYLQSSTYLIWVLIVLFLRLVVCMSQWRSLLFGFVSMNVFILATH